MEKVLRRVLVIIFCLLPFIAQAEDKFFDSAGVSIRYIEKGSGEPIVLLHGFTSDIERGWIENGVLDKLAKDYRVVALDLRGHGKSGKPHEPSQYGKESCQDVVRLLDLLTIQRAHMVGYSYGSVIIAKLLTTNTERFVTATIGGSGGLRNWSEQEEREYGAMASELEHGMPYRSLIRLLWPGQGPPSPEMERRLSQQILAQNDPVAHAALLRAYQGAAVTDEQMAAVTVPTMAIIGSADKKLASVQDLKKTWPALKVVVIQGATHSGDSGALRRGEFVQSILDFLGAHPASSVSAK